MSKPDQIVGWVARVLWIVLALVSITTLTDALDGRSTLARSVVLGMLSVAWTGALVALLVPRTSSLTAARLIVPAGLVATVAVTATGSTVDVADITAITVAVAATLTVLSPWFTESWVDGSSYGPEHRLPLQTPLVLATTVVPLSWGLAVAGAVAGPLLLAGGNWLAGVPVLAAGAGVSFLAVRSLHQLSRRWVVLVPAGMVLHDPLALAEPQMFPRLAVASLAPAPADTDAVDLSGGASGLALQLDLTEPVELLVVKGRDRTETVETASLLFTPARPAHLLDRARHHRIRVPADRA
ncbi:MAG: hypothetical protein H6519_03555 [Microthrixaceae bacterium]|nr:hypothetical protein [Acidimicrobiales bacterium]MCB9403492.1 hypothetical protein [Microthrixaceae bacterium]